MKYKLVIGFCCSHSKELNDIQKVLYKFINYFIKILLEYECLSYLINFYNVFYLIKLFIIYVNNDEFILLFLI